MFRSNPPIEEIEQLFGFAFCDCFAPAYDTSVTWTELQFHDDATPDEAAAQLEQLVLLTAERGLTTFAPLKDLGGALWGLITRLPATIGLMSRVTDMDLSGSHLVSLPREVMHMERLQTFDPYMSYRLHWLPYELSRCPSLRSSRISTRALYGNYKLRPPFPQLPESSVSTGNCSVCDTKVAPEQLIQRWISLSVATDIMPLLVNACSGACVEKLPSPAAGCIPHSHKGGVSSRPPPRRGSVL